ncbi:MAG: hypothetical protein RJA70_4070 [Pseudomonadota bacterium]|jgi:hypothetical protein
MPESRRSFPPRSHLSFLSSPGPGHPLVLALSRYRREAIGSKLLLAAASFSASSLFVVEAGARPDGFAVACGDCHYGTKSEQVYNPKPLVSASVSPERVEPGGSVEISVVVEKKWEDARVAGFLVLADATSALTAIEPDTHNVGTKPAEALPNALGHQRARMLTDGRATFRGSWAAPTAPGAYDFQVFGVTSDDGDGKDDVGVFQEANDPFEQTVVTVGVGCDLVNYYEDLDGDGFGATLRRACAPIARHVEKPGDCDDSLPEVNPGAAERCSRFDENCDGDAMIPLAQYADLDGDGFGALADGINLVSCEPLAGYALEPSDCAPSDPAVFPGAPELPNGKDDNCDRRNDEAGAGGAGGVPTAPTSTASGGAQPGPDAEDADTGASDGGCGIAATQTCAGGWSVGSVLLLGLAGALRARRRHA